MATKVAPLRLGSPHRDQAWFVLWPRSRSLLSPRGRKPGTAIPGVLSPRIPEDFPVKVPEAMNTPRRRKLGRNEPCPCGSGRKYKRCCLGREVSHVPDDSPIRADWDGEEILDISVATTGVAQVSERIVHRNRPRLVEAMRRVARDVHDRVRGHPDWGLDAEGPTQARGDSRRVELTVEALRAVCRRVLREVRHSRQYWFQLVRWSAPPLTELLGLLPLETPAAAPSAASPLDPRWFGEVVKAASHLVLLECPVGEAHEWYDDGDRRGIRFGDVALLEMEVLAKVVSLAQIWYEAKVRYRYTGKGFRAFSRAKEGDALAAQDTSSVELYEERRTRYETISGSAGLWFDLNDAKPLRPDLCGWLALRGVEQGQGLALVSRDPDQRIPLRFLPVPLFESRDVLPSRLCGPPHLAPAPDSDLDHFVRLIPYDYVLGELSAAFEAAVECPAPEVTAFLYAFYAMVSHHLRFERLEADDHGFRLAWVDEETGSRMRALGHWSDASGLGLLRSSTEDWTEALLRHARQIARCDPSVPELRAQRVSQLVETFTWKSGDGIDPDRPLLFIRLSNHTLAADLVFVVDFLRLLLLQASLIGRRGGGPAEKRIGDVTGQWLEAQAARFFIRRLGLDERQVLRNRDLRKSREVDIAFVHGRVLFVIECKSMAKGADHMEGRYSSIRNRQSTFREELGRKCPERIRLIRDGSAADVIAPGTFDRAFGLVCTSAVEYLPTAESHFWQGQVPLVGPPEELVDSIKSLAN